ncbi:uncharacterized protein LOC129922098 [Biomphalaria glabrata]|uniref:Uncharacterized protein LOC129922098 n=1 Tax=Biomphalaria glabrata TaxID=6526 RepID=A0A9W2YIH1_BIOGL|nr:uncharacterized protein LOC129922098 [Biomphalaria glabrata]
MAETEKKTVNFTCQEVLGLKSYTHKEWSSAETLQKIKERREKKAGMNNKRPVKDKNGDLITDEEGQKKRLVDHFQELLYRPTPVNPPKIPPDVELEEQKRTKENFRKRMREVKELDITADNLVKSLESSLKEKEHEVKQEQQRNRELDAKFKNLLQEKESIEAQLKVFKKRKKNLKDELAALEELNAQLVEESSRIIDHTNTNQKIQLCDKKNQENNEPTKVKEQNKQCEHLSDSDSTEIDLDDSIFLQEDVGWQPIDHEQPSSHSVKKVQDQKNKRYLEKAQEAVLRKSSRLLSRSEENLRNTSNEVSNIKSRLIDLEHEKIMLVKQLTQFRSKYNYITRQKDKEIQRLKSELEL